MQTNLTTGWQPGLQGLHANCEEALRGLLVWIKHGGSALSVWISCLLASQGQANRHMWSNPHYSRSSFFFWQQVNVKKNNFWTKSLEKCLPVLITVTKDALFCANGKEGHVFLMSLSFWAEAWNSRHGTTHSTVVLHSLSSQAARPGWSTSSSSARGCLACQLPSFPLLKILFLCHQVAFCVCSLGTSRGAFP